MLTENALVVGCAIAERRGELGMTQNDLAEAVGISARSISNVETGECWPQPGNRLRIERALQWEDGALDFIKGGGNFRELSDKSQQRGAVEWAEGPGDQDRTFIPECVDPLGRDTAAQVFGIDIYRYRMGNRDGIALRFAETTTGLDMTVAEMHELMSAIQNLVGPAGSAPSTTKPRQQAEGTDQ